MAESKLGADFEVSTDWNKWKAEWDAKQYKAKLEIEVEAAKHPNYTFYFAGKIKHTD
jgi:hypothetical protein